MNRIKVNRRCYPALASDGETVAINIFGRVVHFQAPNQHPELGATAAGTDSEMSGIFAYMLQADQLLLAPATFASTAFDSAQAAVSAAPVLNQRDKPDLLLWVCGSGKEIPIRTKPFQYCSGGWE